MRFACRVVESEPESFRSKQDGRRIKKSRFCSAIPDGVPLGYFLRNGGVVSEGVLSEFEGAIVAWGTIQIQYIYLVPRSPISFCFFFRTCTGGFSLHSPSIDVTTLINLFFMKGS